MSGVCLSWVCDSNVQSLKGERVDIGKRGKEVLGGVGQGGEG